MLYLHCGWPRTATTALQGALAARREQLAAAGVLYPDRWRGERWRADGNAHHGVAELFEGDPDARAIAAFRDYLAGNRERTVLISTEFLTEGLPGREGGTLLRLLDAVRDVTPVTCLWSLRCVADLLSALYLDWLALDEPPPAAPLLTLAQWRAVRAFERLLAGIASMPTQSDAVGGRTVYLRYDAGGAHHEELLRVVGLEQPLRAEIVAELRDRPAVNARRSRKALIALLHRERIAARAGVEIPAAALQRAWREGALRFEEDGPCDLVGVEVRRAVHQQAIAISRRSGFTPYPEFFESAEIEPSPPTSLDPDALTDADLERVIACWPG